MRAIKKKHWRGWDFPILSIPPPLPSPHGGGKCFVFVCCLVFLLAACSKSVNAPAGHSVTLIGPEGEEISVNIEIADDNAERAKGLMGRDHLDKGAGMLFVFDEPREASFWMKNTLIPLDILYFDIDGNLVSSMTMTPCLANPCASYPSGGAAAYALEVNEGFVKENGVVRGWRLNL